jgi:hypothetical protein
MPIDMFCTIALMFANSVDEYPRTFYDLLIDALSICSGQIKLFLYDRLMTKLCRMESFQLEFLRLVKTQLHNVKHVETLLDILLKVFVQSPSIRVFKSLQNEVLDLGSLDSLQNLDENHSRILLAIQNIKEIR